ncbi:uncharacterized protein LOC108657627 isoform X2 [Drosophila navojoa]|uniref:uncharacterized protein LOC108657627 isoform X2 n=1 Tax=Drosophila navojoa TaxID=7232 RepID=UPI000847A791|nr:uncharacterized protein LOC108657627 isoform X2 [Drosophila navojoa]
MQLKKLSDLWTHEIIMDAQDNILHTSTCRQWPKSCWMFVKSMSVMQALGMDQHQFLWFSMTLMVISGLLLTYIYKRNIFKLRQQLMLEQQHNQWRYELSMDNLLTNIQRNPELRNATFSDTQLSIGALSQNDSRKSHSFTASPRNALDMDVTRSEKTKISRSQSTQTVSNRARLPANTANRGRQFAQLPDNQRGKYSQQLTAMIARSKKTPIWRH